jgi:hypothetical protein
MGSRVDPQRQNPAVGNLSVKIVLDETKTAIIDAQDIVECFFIEDIFSFCMVGKLTFYDRNGLVEFGPFTGNEVISLVYGTEEEREIVFHIWKVKRMIQIKGNRPTDDSLLELFFVDSSFESMMLPKYSRSFPVDTLYTDVIKHLLRNMVGWEDKQMNIEPSITKTTDNFVIPYWSVTQTIQWLIKRAQGGLSGSSGYLCYNNTYKDFSANVYTLNYLFGENNVIDEQDYVFETTDDRVKNKILEWSMEGVDMNTVGKLKGGTWRGFDSSQKKLIEKDWSFSEGVRDTVLMGRKTFLPDLTNTDMGGVIQSRTGEHNEIALRNTLYSEWVRRYSRQNAFVIMLEGNEKRYAGHQVQIRWPSSDSVSQIFHKQLSGKYLVKSITHHFTGSDSTINYLQKAVLLKNAFQDSDAASLINATKQNTISRNKFTFVRE